MRVLVTIPGPLDAPPTGQVARNSAEALAATGHEVRLLVVDNRSDAAGPSAIRQVRWPLEGSDRRTQPPWFTALSVDGPTFGNLSPEELNTYHETLREAFDGEIEQFDPHIVHCHHVWLLAHLALEGGVPYVVQVYAEELAALVNAPHYQRLAQEAAENAGHLFFNDNRVLGRLPQVFDELDRGMSLLPDDDWLPPKYQAARRATEVYRDVLARRYGRVPD